MIKIMEAMTSDQYEGVSVNQLNHIREKVENMNKFNQIEVLRLLSKHTSVIFNENKYGVHINLSELSTKIIEELEMTFIDFQFRDMKIKKK
jgi:hypothetical protein